MVLSLTVYELSYALRGKAETPTLTIADESIYGAVFGA